VLRSSLSWVLFTQGDRCRPRSRPFHALARRLNILAFICRDELLSHMAHFINRA
jgi:hypothetical protein